MKSLKMILPLLLALCFILSGCEKASEPYDLTVTVRSEGGAPMENAEIFIYADKELSDLYWADETADDGTTEFSAMTGTTYYATIRNAPEGYNVSEYYEIGEDCRDITVDIELLPADSLEESSFKLGSVFYDFSLTATDGKTYTLSSILEEKKAVALNFWFLNCGPCKIEFPYLQEAYEKYAGEIEVLAINPVDGTDSMISAFAEENGLTFPTVKTNESFESSLSLTAYPTTVIIDRYGTVAFIHKGYITSSEEFEKVFDFFCRDDYTQTTINSLNDINDIK